MPDLTPTQQALQVLEPTHITITKNKPGKRNRDAILIQGGASNPSGIARTLVAAISEAMSAPDFRGTDSIKNDPAVRLIVHQLAFLCNVWNIDNSPNVYNDLIQSCHKAEMENIAATLNPNS